MIFPGIIKNFPQQFFNLLPSQLMYHDFFEKQAFPLERKKFFDAFLYFYSDSVICKNINLKALLVNKISKSLLQKSKAGCILICGYFKIRGSCQSHSKIKADTL
jgi:hypothetical protein